MTTWTLICEKHNIYGVAGRGDTCGHCTTGPCAGCGGNCQTACRSNDACVKCGRQLVRGPVGGGHFDLLECPDCTPKAAGVAR